MVAKTAVTRKKKKNVTSLQPFYLFCDNSVSAKEHPQFLLNALVFSNLILVSFFQQVFVRVK